VQRACYRCVSPVFQDAQTHSRARSRIWPAPLLNFAGGTRVLPAESGLRTSGRAGGDEVRHFVEILLGGQLEGATPMVLARAF
jgi:hypothetical protein